VQVEILDQQEETVRTVHFNSLSLKILSEESGELREQKREKKKER
jgi:hypothetical protein